MTDLDNLTAMGSNEARKRALDALYAKLRAVMAESKDGLAAYRYDDPTRTPALADLRAWWHEGKPSHLRHCWNKVPLQAILNSAAINWEPNQPYSPLEKLAREAE